ncbi:MAG: rhombosortase [Steroidobacteraceae bacterium]
MAASNLRTTVLPRFPAQRIANWLTAAGIAALLVVLALAGPGAESVLRYERSAVLSGQAWRLVTGHLVHADAAHLAWNLAGLVLVWWLFAAEFTLGGWCLVMLASTAAIDLGFLLLDPGIEWYVGFSGVLHGCMAAGLLAWLHRDRDWLVIVVAAVFAAKLGWEHFAGPVPFTGGTLSVPVVVEAHTYGAVGGALAALWLLRRGPTADAPL